MSYCREGFAHIYEDVDGGITCSGSHKEPFNTEDTIAMLSHMRDHAAYGEHIPGDVFYAVAIREDLSGR